MKINSSTFEITDDERRTIVAVFGEILRQPIAITSKFICSIAYEEMRTLYFKLTNVEYCRAHGIIFEDEECNEYRSDYDDE